MICYYHNDADGRCAAAILKKYFDYNPGEKITFREVEYNSPVSFDEVKPEQVVWILDYSFKPEKMAELLAKTKNVLWIDHHKTAMEYDYGQHVAGIRRNDHSGCGLTWIYLFGEGSPMPLAVKLIEDYDLWKFNIPNTEAFHEGLKLVPNHPEDPVWDLILHNGNTIGVSNLVRRGEDCILYRRGFCADYVNRFAFPVLFEGYRAYAMNIQGLGSKCFDSVSGLHFDGKEGAEILIAMAFNGKEWIVSLYSDQVDVGEIAKKHGGGGHKGAAGFIYHSSAAPFEQGKDGIRPPHRIETIH